MTGAHCRTGGPTVGQAGDKVQTALFSPLERCGRVAPQHVSDRSDGHQFVDIRRA